MSATIQTQDGTRRVVLRGDVSAAIDEGWEITDTAVDSGSTLTKQRRKRPTQVVIQAVISQQDQGDGEHGPDRVENQLQRLRDLGNRPADIAFDDGVVVRGLLLQGLPRELGGGRAGFVRVTFKEVRRANRRSVQIVRRSRPRVAAAAADTGLDNDGTVATTRKTTAAAFVDGANALFRGE